jgi:hypothetical protein
MSQKRIEKEDKVNFNDASWSSTIVGVVGKRFHNNFKARF